MEDCDVGSLYVSLFKDPWHLHARGNKSKLNSAGDQPKQVMITAHKHFQKVLTTSPTNKFFLQTLVRWVPQLCLRLEGNMKLISDLRELVFAWIRKLATQCHSLARVWHDFCIHPHTLSQRPWKENEKRPWEQETTFTSVWLNSDDPRPPRRAQPERNLAHTGSSLGVQGWQNEKW